MARIGEQYQTSDWKKEKHVPAIECPDTVQAGEFFDVTATIGKEIAHPNTTEHHIVWIKLYYKPEGGKFVYDLAKFDFNAHGASVEGANEGPAYTDHTGKASVKLEKPGTLFATSYCNIHGLWENSKEINVQ